MKKIECFKEWLQWFQNQQPKRKVKNPIEIWNPNLIRYSKQV